MDGTAVNPIAQYLLMALFFGVIAAIPIGVYVLGRSTYGTGDYHQP